MKLQPPAVPSTQEMYFVPGMMQTGKWKSVWFFKEFFGSSCLGGGFLSVLFCFWFCFAFVFVSFPFTVWLLCTVRAKKQTTPAKVSPA